MIKLKILYNTDEEKESLIQALQQEFKILKISKEYKKEGPHRRIYADLKNK
ncbi:hypothetical protein [Clostridium algidicarnis]|uniref:hypothetical protein n=1 Tax=Clostridium algidicarnis TaxID=37659 RepID=UPI001C0B6E68|nr:hypothetical protein [Clostridium algidicarnis]MBU3203733.1 hypothetical protein [Clostridium algidicarnis]MBU3211887.1 hypothetical protein [Clostridium algidicarnis]MBU3221607.1 hypothetical protein [Clostridium algidicarnis]